MHFPVGALPVVKNLFKNIFLIKCYKITVKKKNERFGQYLKKAINLFPIVF